MRRELIARVPQLTDRWTDFNASDLGVVLLELFCGVGDMLAYYLDAQAAEAFKQLSRLKYGRAKEFVDREIIRRIGA